jgi:hypothetical protein
VSDLTSEIREIYQRWLEGGLSQEDALFSIGDTLDEAGGPAECGHDATGTKPGAAYKSS